MKLSNYYIVLVLLLSSCSSNIPKEFQSFVDLHKNESNYKCYVIIPVHGCVGCYNTAEQFVIRNASQMNSINFYIAGYISDKAMRIRYGKDIVSLKNVNKVDCEEPNDIWFKDLLYPTTVFLDGDRVDSIAISDFTLLGDL